MFKKLFIVLISTTVAAWVFGCAQPSLLDKNFGRSFESARYNQILNPKAENRLDPVEGMDGRAAENIMNNYLNETTRDQKSTPGSTSSTTSK